MNIFSLLKMLSSLMQIKKNHSCIVTELLGQSLYDKYLQNEQPIPKSTIQSIMLKCLKALNILHEQGIIHCDIKPENIVLNQNEDKIKIIDFGSAIFIGQEQQLYIQTKTYRAPEIMFGFPPTEKIDMWSLGCVFFELLTHKLFLSNTQTVFNLAKIISLNWEQELSYFKKGQNYQQYVYNDRYIMKRDDIWNIHEIFINKKAINLQQYLSSFDIQREEQQLLIALLNIDPIKRPQAVEILNFEYFKKIYNQFQFCNFNSNKNHNQNIMLRKIAKNFARKKNYSNVVTFQEKKFVNSLRDDKELKNFSKNQEFQYYFEQKEQQVQTISTEEFEPLSRSLQNIESNYKFIKLDKQAVNKKLKSNFVTTLKIQHLYGKHELKTENNEVSELATIINQLNCVEQDKFQKANFIKKMKQKFIEMERNIPENYYHENPQQQNKEYQYLLDKVENPIRRKSIIHKYDQTLRDLKNSKIKEFLEFDPYGDENLKQYQLDPYKTTLLEDSSIKEETSIIPSKSKVDQLEESKQEEQRIFYLSEKQLSQAQFIQKTEEQIFMQNKLYFGNPVRFTQMNYQTQLYHLKHNVDNFKYCLNFGRIILSRKMDTKILLPIHLKLGEIILNKNKLYSNNEYLDLFLIKHPYYKELTKINLKRIPTLSLKELSQFWMSFLNIHKRENGQIIGNLFYKALEFFYNRFIFILQELTDEIDPQMLFDFSVCLQALTYSEYYLQHLSQSEFIEKILIIILKNSFQINQNNSLTYFHISNFTFKISQYIQNDLIKEILDKNLKDLTLKSNILINPSNLADYFQNLKNILNMKMNQEFSKLLSRFKSTTLPEIIDNLQINDLVQISDFMIQSKQIDRDIYIKIRHQYLSFMDDDQKRQGNQMIKLINNFLYLDICHTYQDLFQKEELIPPNLLSFYKFLFKLNFTKNHRSIKEEYFLNEFNSILSELEHCQPGELLNFVRTFLFMNSKNTNLQTDQLKQIINDQIPKFTTIQKIQLFSLLSFFQNTKDIALNLLSMITNELSYIISLSILNPLNDETMVEFLLGYYNVSYLVDSENNLYDYFSKCVNNNISYYPLQIKLILNFYQFLQSQEEIVEDLKSLVPSQFSFIEKYLLMFSSTINNEDFYNKQYMNDLFQFKKEQILQQRFTMTMLNQLLIDLIELIEIEKVEVQKDCIVQVRQGAYFYFPIYLIKEKKGIIIVNDYDRDFNDIVTSMLFQAELLLLEKNGIDHLVLPLSKLMDGYSKVTQEDLKQQRKEIIKNLFKQLQNGKQFLMLSQRW